MHPLGTYSAPIVASQNMAPDHEHHAAENRTLADFETMLADTSGDRSSHGPAAAAGTSRVWRRILPIVLLAVAGAAFALTETDLRDTLTTGRSVAHAPSGRQP